MVDTSKINLRDLIRKEYQKCALDPAYFMKNYVYIQHPIKGRLLFDLYDYQKNVLQTIDNERYTIVLKARQIGLSTVISCYALWLMLFHKDKNVLVIATKQETAKNIVTKVKFAFDNLPVWLQVPTVENNKLSLRFKNGSTIKALSSSEDTARSEAVSLLVMDEAAFIKNAEEIWGGAQSTLATGGKGVLISTPNGIGNFFFKKYTEAEEFKGRKKDDVFYPIKLDWRVHPDRNPEWRAKQNKILGDMMARQEYDAEFLGSGNTVIDSFLIEEHRKKFAIKPLYTTGMDGNVWVWKEPDYTKSYIVVADVGRGENSDDGDFSAFHVIQLDNCEQVAEYKGRIPTTQYGHLLIEISTKYNDALLVIENGGIGWATIQTVIDRGYKNLFYMTEDLKYLDPEAQYTNKLYHQDKKSVAGFNTSVRTRPLIISKLDQYMRESDDSLIIHSTRTLDELLTFIWENGKAQAANGFHDDLVMSLSIALWIRDTALELHQKGIELVKSSLNKISKIDEFDTVYRPKPFMQDPYKMKIGSEDHDLRWLLR